MATKMAPPAQAAPAETNGQSYPVKDQLYATFNEALNKTKAEVAQLQEKLKEYDEKYEASSTVKKQGQKATAFITETLDEIKATLDSLGQKAKDVFTSYKELAADTIHELWNSLKEATERLKKVALEFDEKYKLSATAVELTKPLITRLKVFNDSLLKAVDSVADMGKSGRLYVIGAAASLEHKYKIESRFEALDEKYKLKEKAKNLQEKGEEFLEKQHIRERVLEIDEKLTGKKASAALEHGVEMMKQGLGVVQQEFKEAVEQL